MCSSTRGPAMVPSLVTWPTRITVKPRALASRISSCAEARTWLTVPGALSRLSRYMVWIESITTTCGRFGVVEGGDDVAHRLVAAASCTGAAGDAEPRRPQPHLVERFLARDIGAIERRCRSCLRPAPPSPAAARSICRCRDRRRSAAPSPAPCRRRRPGRTRRCRSCAARLAWLSPVSPTKDKAAALARSQALGRRAAPRRLLDQRVPAPQASHLPAHLGWAAPQLWQT